MRQAGTVQTHHERLWAPPSWWVGVGVFGAVWGWVALVVGSWLVAGVVTVVVAGGCGALLWRYGNAVLVRVDGSGLTAGRAHLEPEHVGAASALDAAATRAALGPGGDARAWLLVRPYITTAVRVEVADTADPTPYWLVSTRDPAGVVAALETVNPRGDSHVPHEG